MIIKLPIFRYVAQLWIFAPLITKPKRLTDHSSTIIDHIYSNVFRKVINAGICLADVFGPSTNILYSRK